MGFFGFIGWYGNIGKIETQLSHFKVNHINIKNILDFMHFELMCFLMPNLPSLSLSFHMPVGCQ